MTTGTKVIQRALGHLNVHSVLSPANPESIIDGMDVLNSFIASLQDDNVDIGAVPLSAPGDDLSEPLGARNAIEYNLAVLMQPLFPGKQISPVILREAPKLLASLKRQWRTVSIPKKQVSSTLIKGSGHKSYGYGSNYFEEGDEIG